MAGIKTAFNSNTYRIVEYCLLKFFKTNDIHNFKYLEYSDEKPTPTLFKHFVSSQNKAEVEQAVWTDGEYAHRINKVYDSLPLVTPTKNHEINSTKVSVVLKQGFSWTDVFGIHVLIKGTQSKDIYVSKVLFINDFKINDNKELIQGSFWIEQSDVLIPRTDEILACQITTIKFSDIQADGPTIGYIYNYPEYLEPLIAEKPIPDFIQTNLDIDILSNYIKIKPVTTEAKTLEKSILDYFGQTTADITIEHVVRFGNDEDGYQSLRVSNEHNKFGEVTLGLDFTQFEKTNDYDEISDALRNMLFEEVYIEIEALRVKNAELEAQKILNNNTIIDLTNQLEIKTNRVIELEKELDGVKKDNQRLENEIVNRDTEIDSLRETVENQNISIDELIEANTKLTTSNTEKQSEIDSLKMQIIVLNSTIATLNQEITDKDITISKNNEKITSLENTVETQIAEISSLNTTIVSKDNEINSLNIELAKSSNIIIEKNNLISVLETDINEKKQTINNQILEIKEKTKKITELETKVIELEELKKQLETTIENLNNQISGLESNVTDLTNLVSEKDSIINESTIKVQTLNS